MPQYSAGSIGTAKITFTNPKLRAVDYYAWLFMGADYTPMAGVSFSLNAGQSKEVEFTVTMPSVEGTYPVYVGVFSDDILIPPFIHGSEDVIVTPLPYEVGVSFVRERSCDEGHMEGDTWVCTRYSASERYGHITVVNQGAPGQLVITVEGWFYLSGVQGGAIGGANKQWTDYFGIGQAITYTFYYTVPITGMPLDARFFVKVYDLSGNLIADEVFITSL